MLLLAIGGIQNLVQDSYVNRCRLADSDGLIILSQVYYTSESDVVKTRCLHAVKNLLGNSMWVRACDVVRPLDPYCVLVGSCIKGYRDTQIIFNFNPKRYPNVASWAWHKLSFTLDRYQGKQQVLSTCTLHSRKYPYPSHRSLEPGTLILIGSCLVLWVCVLHFISSLYSTVQIWRMVY